MTREEYERVKDYTYEEYCKYLDKKYCDIHKFAVHPEYNGVYLFKHHTLENKKANLSDPEIAKTATEEERDTITLCDFLEHLFLHILIGEQTDARNALGIGGAITYIIPQIENYFEMGDTSGYAEEYFSNLDYDLFEELKDRCDNALEEINVALDHNQTVYLEAKNYLNTKGRALVVIGTGLGKTTTALEYLKEFKCRALVIGPNNLIKSGWEEYAGWVDVTTYQTFANEYYKINYNQYGLVIIDEAHHAGFDESTGKGAKVWSAGIKYILDKGVKVLGLTATPERSDGINIGDTLFEGCVCEGFAVEDGIEKGIIYPFSYVTAYYDTTGLLEEYSNCDNKELVGQLDLAINNTPTVKDIFKRRMPEGKRKGIVFIQEIEDEQNVLSIMQDIYPQVEMRIIHSKMSNSEVEANRDWFEKTDEGYLLAVNMISEGAHYKGVNTLIMFRRTNSYLVFTQQLGRIITLTKNENPNAIVFDLVNNIENIEYGNRKKDEKEHSIKKIIKALKNTDTFKSDQIIVADETRDIVRCIKEIKKEVFNYWTVEEDNILKKYYAIEGRLILERLKGRTWDAVVHRAKAFGIKLSRDAMLCKPWEKECLQILEKEYPLHGRNIPALIKKGYTCAQIDQKARREGITYNQKMSWGIWTIQEDEYLKYIVNNKKVINRNEVVRVFKKQYPNRTSGSIKARMKTLRLSNIKNVNFWTAEEDEIIKKYYPSMGTECVKMLPNRTKASIKTRAKFLKVSLVASAANAKKVICLELNQVFTSANEAMNTLNTQGIDTVCRGESHTCKGYHWAYLEDFNKSHMSNHEYILEIERKRNTTRRKRVRCIETEQIFESLKNAVEITKITSIAWGIKNNKLAGGYHWEYIEEEE